MEISPRRSVSLDFDNSVIVTQSASSYPPTYGNWMPSVYTMQGMKSCSETKLGSPYVMTKSSLSMDSATMSMVDVPKKENFISSIFGTLTNMIVEGFAKIPSTLLANINNNLSVTVVPNEGIISPEFFKNLTRSSEQLASENKDERTNDAMMRQKSSDEIVYDVKNSLSHIFTDNIEKMTDKLAYKIEKISDKLMVEKMAGKLKFESSNEIEVRENGEMKNIDYSSEKNIDGSSTLRSTVPKVSRDKVAGMAEDGATNEWRTMFRRVFNGCSSGYERLSQPRASSPEFELPTKRANLSKPRRKSCTAARGRGKGRGKSQLRRNGVSQSRHRKERTKQNIYSNIQDDIEDFENSEQRRDFSDDEDENSSSSTSFHDSKNCPVLIETLSLESSSQKLNKRLRKINSNCRVRYVPEATMDVDNYGVDELDCSANVIGSFRPRLISESSVDSEDSYCIVFENNSESEYTDYDYDPTSDDDMDEDVDDDEKTIPRVRFNLEPQIHTMIKWDFAYRAARRGPWEEIARDRERFRSRIYCIERILNPILSINHRRYIWQNRFGVDG